MTALSARSIGPQLALLFVLASSMLASTASVAMPSFPPPPGASIQKVSGELTSNGVAMDIRRFDSEDTVESVVNFYKRRWAKGQDDLPGYREAFAEPWFVLSRIEGKHLLALQIQPVGSRRSWGYLSISNLPGLVFGNERAGGPGLAVPSMAGSHVLDDTSSEDPGKRGRLVSLVNDYSLTGNVTFYRDHYRALGWRSEMDRPFDTGHALTYSSDGRQVRIVIQGTNEGGATVVVNEVEAIR